MTQSLCIITGSTLGGAEYVADHLNDVLETQGFQVDLFNNATFADVQSCRHLLVVTSTHGAGELPENLQPLFDEITAQAPDLSHITFGIIGLGSSDYDTFCNAVNIVESVLKKHGATQMCDSLRIDVTQNFDHDSTAEAWLPNFIDRMGE